MCVFLSSSEQIDRRYFELAEQLGTQMCERGINLVSGGGGISTMGALARAVRSGGGHTTGVIPRRLMALEVGDVDADELLVTSDMRDSKALMDRRSDAFLALPGGLGTLEELVEVWVGRTLGMHKKPVVILDPWNDFAALRDLVEGLKRSGLVRDEAAADATWCATIDEALDVIESGWRSGEGRILPESGDVEHPDEWLEAD
ncbi:MAG: TIGR00730 family Rossman fold protein [Actinobacteria bacterium]|nr:TIGR00730 family Rossman fold protein [Actinomycetota bacterium]